MAAQSSVFYRQDLDKHYRYSPHKKVLAHPSVTSKMLNYSCGDIVSFQLNITKEGLIREAGFQGNGCIISQAAASLLAECIEQKNTSTVLAFDTQCVLNLIALPLGPTRLNCAMLALQAVHEGIRIHDQSNRST
jgi:nitrogen fixation protein NifU and related proteins